MPAPEIERPASRPAPFVARLRSALIDWLVPLFVALTLSVMPSVFLLLCFANEIPDYVRQHPAATEAWLIGGSTALHAVATIIVTLPVTIWPAGRTGQSSGMTWARIRLIDRNSGTPVGVPRSFARRYRSLP